LSIKKNGKASFRLKLDWSGGLVVCQFRRMEKQAFTSSKFGLVVWWFVNLEECKGKLQT
jgi:hypothetical protein